MNFDRERPPESDRDECQQCFAFEEEINEKIKLIKKLNVVLIAEKLRVDEAQRLSMEAVTSCNKLQGAISSQAQRIRELERDNVRLTKEASAYAGRLSALTTENSLLRDDFQTTIENFETKLDQFARSRKSRRSKGSK